MLSMVAYKEESMLIFNSIVAEPFESKVPVAKITDLSPEVIFYFTWYILPPFPGYQTLNLMSELGSIEPGKICRRGCNKLEGVTPKLGFWGSSGNLSKVGGSNLG